MATPEAQQRGMINLVESLPVLRYNDVDVLMLRVTNLVFEVMQLLRSEEPELILATRSQLAHFVEVLDRSVMEALEKRLRIKLRSLLVIMEYITKNPNPSTTPWANAVAEQANNVPTMSERETLKFYSWISGLTVSTGPVIEVGCWLGSASLSICANWNPGVLTRNRLHVYDSFIWNSWMNDFFDGASADSCTKDGHDFSALFERNTAACGEFIVQHKCNLDADDLLWSGGEPIGLLVYDAGSDSRRLENVWRTFSPSFVSGKTVVVFNEFGQIRSSAIWEFCLRHPCLIPLYKPRTSAKAFLFDDKRDRQWLACN